MVQEDGNWRKEATRRSNDGWRGRQTRDCGRGKAFLLGVERCCGESSSAGRGRTRPLNRILEAAKMRREPKRGLSEQNERWGTAEGRAA